MPTQQLTAGFNVSSGFGGASVAANAAAAALNGSASLGAFTASLFRLLHDFLEEEETDNTLRRDALSLLVAYHILSLADAEHTALEVLARINKDATLLVRDQYGCFGKKPSPIDAPLSGQLAEFQNAVGTERANKGLTALPGTN